MDPTTLEVFDRSLRRCDALPYFLDIFYTKFLDSSPEVAKKFVNTDFVRQKRALRASLHHLLLAAQDQEKGPDAYLSGVAERHGEGQLEIGAELYDLWLDSLLATVKECDPEFSPEVEKAWEDVMMVGIQYLCRSYHGRRGG
ncbi:MAG TPA: globin [Thermoanaerobaculia bacterium]|nr:globin [Thermoanaerobaculia bacterium]